MRVQVKGDYRELSATAARFVARRVLAGLGRVLLLPTGETPKGMYAALAGLVEDGLVDLSEVSVFNLDEFLDLEPGDPRTFRTYMRRHLWNRIVTQPSAWHIPSSRPKDEEAECAAYERALAAAGGVDLAVLGIGDNGHIGYNEPGTPWGSRTHVAELALDSFERERARAEGDAETPRRAITVGIKTIMRSREILLLASGERKAQVLERALHGPVRRDLPASILQLHPRLTVVADVAAAAELSEAADCWAFTPYSETDRGR